MGTILTIYPRSIGNFAGIRRFFASIVSFLINSEQRQRDRAALRHLADDPRLLADVGLSRPQILALLEDDRP